MILEQNSDNDSKWAARVSWLMGWLVGAMRTSCPQPRAEQSECAFPGGTL